MSSAWIIGSGMLAQLSVTTATVDMDFSQSSLSVYFALERTTIHYTKKGLLWQAE